MGRNIKIMLLTGLILTAASALYGQRGTRGRSDTSSVQRSGREMHLRQLPPAGKNFPDSIRKRWIEPGYRHGYGRKIPFDQGLWNMPSRRDPERFGPGWFYGPRHAPFPEPYRFRSKDFVKPVPHAVPFERPLLPFLYRIPDLSEKQKQEIESLLEKFRDEMTRFREENRKKMEEMRKSHLENIKNILTPQQRKWIEERVPSSSDEKRI